jgi:AcrR family transcriptional regulator
VSPRKYEMKRRAEQVDATRQRIIEATLELHLEQGVLATSVRDIAARADVAPGTVLRYFPQYEDVVTACGMLVRDRLPAPTSGIFDGATTLEQRVERLVAAWFRFHSARPNHYSLLVDRAALRPLDDYMSEIDRQHRRLCAEALAPVGSPRAAAHLLRAVTDYGVWRSLSDSGSTPERAARQLCGLLSHWLATMALASPDHDERAATPQRTSAPRARHRRPRPKEGST